MPSIFISYRREDSAAFAGRLFDRLSQHFGSENVFRDIDSIDSGAEFAKVIAGRVAGCDALIAVIGKDWLGVKDTEGRRRLDQPDDFVSAEISQALTQNKLVIPALIEGALMPAESALPAQMATLAGRNAIEISDARFDYDVGRLIETIEKVIAPRELADNTTAAPQRKWLWMWSGHARTQHTLALLGVGLGAVVIGVWTAHMHFTGKSETAAPKITASPGAMVVGGNVNATASPGGVAVVTTGSVTIGITLAEYEEKLKKREQELREEFARTNKADKEKLVVMEKQLADLEAKARSPAANLEKYKEILVSAAQSLGRIKPNVPASELESARQALARGDTSHAERLFEQALSADKQRAAEGAYQLGRLAESRIDYAKASNHYLEAFKLQPDNARYVRAAGRLAYILGRYAEARPLLERALALERESHGANAPEIAEALNNLAVLYVSQGLYAEAEGLYLQSLAIWKQSLGPDHPEIATGLGNLAELYRYQGLYAKAEPLYQEVLAIEKKSLGPDHPGVAVRLNNLALLYYSQGLYAKAEPLYQQAITIKRKTRAPDGPDLASSLNNLAELYRRQGLYVKAEPLYLESLAISKKYLGPDHPSVARYLNNLAELYRTQGLYEKAARLFNEALSIWKKSLGPDHPDIGQSLNNLAAVYYSQGFYAKAEPLYLESLAIKKKSLGPDHPEVALTLRNLGLLYASQKLFTKAEPMYQQSLAIRRKSLGPDHPDVAQSLQNLAEVYLAQRLYDRAEPLLQQSLTIQRKSFGPDHPEVVKGLNFLAVLYFVQGLYAQAEPLLQEALAIRKRSLGPDDPEVGESLNNLAVLYYLQGDYTKAEPLYQQSLAIRRKSFGPIHRDVASSLESYAELLVKMKRNKEAVALQSEAKEIRAQLARRKD